MAAPDALALVALHLIVLHSIDGHEVMINPEQVTSLHHAKEGEENKYFVEGVNCVVSLTDGKLVTVAESCDAVKQALEDK